MLKPIGHGDRPLRPHSPGTIRRNVLLREQGLTETISCHAFS